MRRGFPHAAIAAFLFACGGNSASLRGPTAGAGNSTDAAFAHIVPPPEDGDDNVPVVVSQPVSGAEAPAEADPEPEADAIPEIEVPQVGSSDTAPSQD